ncbi:MAG: condensation domain-containing protein, partial [Spirillospora sp.]
GVDDWSAVPLSRDFAAAFAARRRGRAPEWEPLPVSYTDYTLWAHEVVGAVGERQISFWREALAGLPGRIVLPYDRRPSTAERGPGAFVEFQIDPGLHRAIDALAAKTGTSMFMVFQAALATLLTRRGAGGDLPIASMVAGRGEEWLADLVGCFSNTVLLRTDTTGDPGFEALLGRVRETDLAAFDRQDVPFDRVVSALGLAAPQVLLVHHEQAGLADVPDGDAAFELVPTGALGADLTLAFYEPHGAGPVDCLLHYDTALFDRATVSGLAGELLTILRRNTR